MDYINLFSTSVAIIGKNKLVWLFSLLIAISSISFQFNKNLVFLSCFISIVELYVLTVGSLGMAFILYQGYLGQPARLKDIWAKINSYIFRWIGLLIISGIVSSIPLIIIYLIAQRLPLILAQLILTFPGYYFFTFYFNYLMFAMITNKLGVNQTLKLAMRAWSYNTRLKIIISSLSSFIIIIFSLVLVIIQKGFSFNPFVISYKDYQIINNMPISRLLTGIFEWLILPIVTAFIMLVYMNSIGDNDNIQNS